MKEFVTAVAEVEDEAEGVEEYTFMLDGTQIKYYKPDPAQVAVLMASTYRHAAMHTQVAGVINFFVQVLDEPSHAYIVERLLDRKDSFGLEQVEEIMEWMMEEWTGRPTQPPSDSTQ